MEAAKAHLSLHLSKCHIVGNHMSKLISFNQKIGNYGQDIPKLHTADQGREECNDQESIQLSTTPDLEHHIGK